jgi:hypothetical protein
MRAIAVVLFLATSCGGSCNRQRDACGYDPKCEPVTIGGSMTVACRCYDHPVRQLPRSR